MDAMESSSEALDHPNPAIASAEAPSASAEEGLTPSSETGLPESFNADRSDVAETGFLNQEAASAPQAMHHSAQQSRAPVQSKGMLQPEGVGMGQNAAPKKGNTFQSTLDAGAQAFGSVRAVVAKNLASLQASRDATKQSATSDKNSGPLDQSAQKTPGDSSSEKQGLGSGLSFASLGSRFQSLKQTAVKAVSQPVRHLVSQNKRRFMDGEYDLDLSYITENIIAMGFPAGDLSSGLFGYVEGFYRNHMEEVVRFLDAHHKGKCKVFNLCSERLYDSSLFEGLVACFPFDDHNCPPLPLLKTFCDSAYDWLKRDKENMVVVHCKAGKSRTGLMICCLLLYLKLFDSADEAIKFYNSKRCTDNLGLTLPSQIRYVHYFETILRNGGETPRPEARVLRGIRLHKCPYWIRPSISVLDHNGVIFSTKKHPRTKDLSGDDLWHKAPRKGVMVFALPGERCVADLSGDFKILFHDRHGDFYCWLNTSMIGTRQFLETKELDWFDRRRLPSPGFQVEVVVLDPATQAVRSDSGTSATTSQSDGEALAPRNLDGPMGFGTLGGSGGSTETGKGSVKGSGKGGKLKTTREREEDEVFGDSEEDPSPRPPPPSTSGQAPPLGTLTAHLPGGSTNQAPGTASGVPGETVGAASDRNPTEATEEAPRPTPRTDPPSAAPLEPSDGVKRLSHAARLLPESTERVLTTASTSEAKTDDVADSLGSNLDVGKAQGEGDGKAGSQKGGQASGVSTQAEPSDQKMETPESSISVAPETLTPPVASTVFADDWEADVFGSEGGSIVGGTGKSGAAAVSSDFAKMAIAGSANASEFSLGDDDDFDSDDGL